MTEPDWTQVHRVEDETGSHIEPPLDETWPDLWKLRWKAAIVSREIGCNIHIGKDAKRAWYGLSYHDGKVGVGSSLSLTFNQMWAELNGIRAGHEIARHQAEARAAR